jgi:putative ABC transport system ATP-binding protein
MPVLRLDGVSKTFGEGDRAVCAVQSVSFEADAGEFISIVGPSGSGKTTLLAMIGALLTPSEGRIELNGSDLTDLGKAAQARFRRQNVGFVFQANNVLPFLTARENMMIMGDIAGMSRAEAARRAGQLLEELGITDRADAVATELSGGERQRVAIGRALMHDPAVILVDEPTASLDSERGQMVVESLVREVKDRQKLGIMVTHDLNMAGLTDRILEMRDGVVRERAARPD